WNQRPRRRPLYSGVRARSCAQPKRGQKTPAGEVYEYFEMPLPAWRMPFVAALPEPGIGVPMRAAELVAPGTPTIWPVRGSFACWVEQVAAPPAHPGTYNVGAAAGEYLSVKKFDIWLNWSYCGCWCVSRTP